MSAIKSLRANLRQLRKKRELTQEQVAERAGLTYRHYQDIEAAALPGLQLATVERLARVFGVATWRLLLPTNDSNARRVVVRSPRGASGKKTRAS